MGVRQRKRGGRDQNPDAAPEEAPSSRAAHHIVFPERHFEIGQRVLYRGRFSGTITGCNYVAPSIALIEGLNPRWEYWIALDPFQKGLNSPSLEVLLAQEEIHLAKDRGSQRSIALAV